MAHLETKPMGFMDWFRSNPGHAMRALPLSFAVFSVIMVIGVFQPSGAAGAFVTAAVVASVAGGVHVVWRYVKALLATRPAPETSVSGGFTLADILMWLTIVAMLLGAVTSGISALANR